MEDTGASPPIWGNGYWIYQGLPRDQVEAQVTQACPEGWEGRIVNGPLNAPNGGIRVGHMTEDGIRRPIYIAPRRRRH